MNISLENLDIKFYNFTKNRCRASVFFKEEHFFIKNIDLKTTDNFTRAYMPEIYDRKWPHPEINWIELRTIICREFIKNGKPTRDESCNFNISIHDITDNGTALFDLFIPDCDFEMRDGTIRYMNEKNIHVNFSVEIIEQFKTMNVNRMTIVQEIRKEYLNQINGMEVHPFEKENSLSPVAETNKYGRIKNASNAPFKFVPNTELLTQKKISFSDVDKLILALSYKQIGPFEIDTLSCIESFRYVTTTMIIDLFASGYISHGQRKINKEKLSDIFNRLAKHNLINISNFVSFEDNDKDNIALRGVYQIYTLAKSGSTLLSEMRRENHYNPFDVFQNGNKVKEILSANQWLVYWLSSYPDEIKNNYDTSRKIYPLGSEKSGAKAHALVNICGKSIIGEPVRRTYDFESSLNEEDIKYKLTRLLHIINFDGELYTKNGYIPSKFSFDGQPVLCYICEDDAHMKDIFNIIQPVIKENPKTDIWFTTDARIFNYSYEDDRFFTFNENGEIERVDTKKILGLGKERAYEEEEESEV